MSVLINGVPAVVLRQAPTLITIEVPASAGTGPMRVPLPDGTQIDLGLFRVEQFINDTDGDRLPDYMEGFQSE